MKRFIVMAGVLALAACGTSADPSYFTLARINGATLDDVHVALKIERPTLAKYLDRPDIVSELDPYRVTIDETRQWTEPLDEMTEGVLAQDLQQRLSGADVSTEDAVGKTPRFVIDLRIDHFNEQQGSSVVLQGALTVTDKTTGHIASVENINFSGDALHTTESKVEVASILLGKLADEVSLIIEKSTVAPH